MSDPKPPDPPPPMHVVHHYYQPPMVVVAPRKPWSNRAWAAAVVGMLAAACFLGWMASMLYDWSKAGDVSACVGRSPADVDYDHAKRACERDRNAW